MGRFWSTHRIISIIVASLVFFVDRVMKVLTNRGDLHGAIGVLQFTTLHNYGAIGGALGNTYDRMVYGYVTDMLHFPHSNGVFNLSDASLQVGGILMLLHFFIQPRRDR